MGTAFCVRIGLKWAIRNKIMCLKTEIRLWEGPIPREEESYQVWCVWVWSKFSINPLHVQWIGRRRWSLRKEGRCEGGYEWWICKAYIRTWLWPVWTCVLSRYPIERTEDGHEIAGDLQWIRQLVAGL